MISFRIFLIAIGFIFTFMTKNSSACTEKKMKLEGDYDVTQITPDIFSKKSLIIIPPTGGTNLVDRSYARKFCKKGYDVYIINDWPRPGEDSIDLEVHQHFYSNAQKAISAVVSSLKTPFIGLLGTSVGALHASIAANSIERINAVFFIVGGLPIPEVVVTSDQRAMVELREARRKKYHFKSDQENIDGIDHVFSLEPSKLGNMHLKKSFGVVLATKDSTVSYATQKKLQDFFQPEVSIVFNNDHFWAIVKTWLFHSDQVVSFFEERVK